MANETHISAIGSTQRARVLILLSSWAYPCLFGPKSLNPYRQSKAGANVPALRRAGRRSDASRSRRKSATKVAPPSCANSEEFSAALSRPRVSLNGSLSLLGIDAAGDGIKHG